MIVVFCTVGSCRNTCWPDHGMCFNTDRKCKSFVLTIGVCSALVTVEVMSHCDGSCVCQRLDRSGCCCTVAVSDAQLGDLLCIDCDC